MNIFYRVRLLVSAIFLTSILGFNATNSYGSCKGMKFRSFETKRTTFGSPDNDSDGLPDASGVLNSRNISYHNLLMGDEFEATFGGEVHKASRISNWEYGYAQSRLSNGVGLVSPLSASISIYDKSSNETYSCGNLPIDASTSGSDLVVRVDFALDRIREAGCTIPNNYNYNKDDLVTVTVTYKVVGNIGPAKQRINFANEFKVSSNGDYSDSDNNYGCENRSSYVEVLGFHFESNLKTYYDSESCETVMRQDYLFCIGDIWNASDYFPYEYRNWASVRELKLRLPSGFSLKETSFKQFRSLYKGWFDVEYQNNVEPDAEANNVYTYDLRQYHVANGGNINYSNNTFVGYVYATILSDGTAPSDVYHEVDWSFTFDQDELIGGGVTAPSLAKSYVKSKPVLNYNIDVSNPVIDYATNTISWNVALESTSGFLTFPWMYFEDGSGITTDFEVIELQNNTVLNPQNNIFQGLGITGNVGKYKVTADYSACIQGDIIIHIGNNTLGFPASINDIDCVHFVADLSFPLSESKMTANINLPKLEDGYPLPTTVEIISKGTGAIKDVKLEIDVPDNESIKLEPGSFQVEHPIGSGYQTIADPVLEFGKYTVYLADALAGTDGSNSTYNQINVKFNFEPNENFESGDGVDIIASANTTCDEPLPSIEDGFILEHLFERSLIIPEGDAYNSWGFSWGDYDNDGYPDLFVTNYEVDQPNRLYRNNGDGSFSAATQGSIVNDLASSLGSTWGDYDNDGDLDLYVTNNVGFANALYRNNGDGTFTSIQNDPVVEYKGYSHGVSWVDYDNDGFLDLFIADFFSTNFNLLYKNNQDGTFTKVQDAAIVLEAASSTSGIWGDYDNDGDQDLFVANYNNEKNSLYRNDGNGRFTKIVDGEIVNDTGQSTGGSWGDIDNDGDLDLFVSNAGDQNNYLYKNNGDGSFTKVTGGVIVSEGGHSHGSAFSDYDNDGDLDLVVANDNGQNNFFYINLGDGTFEAVDLDLGLTRRGRTGSQVRGPAMNSFAVAWADVDNDGDEDLYIVNHGENENILLINQGGNYRHSACINLQGLSSNIAAIGSRISVKARIYGEDVWQTREITGQSGGGISAQNDIEQHFGLGDADVIDSLIIEWPSGYTQIETNIDIETGCLSIPEEAGGTISGVAFYDENGDCLLNNGESVLSNIEITIQPTGQKVYTDENGAYSITLPLGEYTFAQINSGNWVNDCGGSPQSHTVDVKNFNTTFTGYNFPNQTSGNCTNVDLTVSGATTALRVGFNSLLAFTITNNGVADATGVEVAVDMGGEVIPQGATVPWASSTGSVYNWELGDILIGESVTIYVSTEVDATATVGETVNFAIDAIPNEADCDVSDNTFRESALLVGAIDPNDILVTPEGAIPSSEILYYKIRFQNVGNHEVKRVVINDRLPEELDINTLELGSASDTYRFRIEDDRTLIWEFENINLPDSISNEPESHGFVTFRIRPKAGLANGTRINNLADIYFDFNEPITTNTVTNIIDDKAPDSSGQLKIFPNPVHTQASFEIIPKDLNLKQVQIKSLKIYNTLGQLVIHERNVEEYQYKLHNITFTKGYYVIKVLGEDNNEYVGSMIMH